MFLDRIFENMGPTALFKTSLERRKASAWANDIGIAIMVSVSEKFTQAVATVE